MNCHRLGESIPNRYWCVDKMAYMNTCINALHNACAKLSWMILYEASYGYCIKIQPFGIFGCLLLDVPMMHQNIRVQLKTIIHLKRYSLSKITGIWSGSHSLNFIAMYGVIVCFVIIIVNTSMMTSAHKSISIDQLQCQKPSHAWVWVCKCMYWSR